MFNYKGKTYTQEEKFEKCKELFSISKEFLKTYSNKDLWLKPDLFLSSFALTKAEHSELTEEDAYQIYKKYINRKKILTVNNFIKNNKEEYDAAIAISKWTKEYVKNNPKPTEQELMNYSNEVIKLLPFHDKLEYFNILNTLIYIEKNKEYLLKDIKENGITKNLLINLHIKLTDGMDDIFYKTYMPHYHPYFSGEVRTKNNVKVWNYLVWDCNEIDSIINKISELSKNIKDINDVFMIHWYLYRAHVFYNGNKRLCRCIEMLLMDLYGFDKAIPSYGYYLINEKYLEVICDSLIKDFNKEKWLLFSNYQLLLSYKFKHINFFKRETKINNLINNKIIYHKNKNGKKIDNKIKKLINKGWFKEYHYRWLNLYIINLENNNSFINNIKKLIDLSNVSKDISNYEPPFLDAWIQKYNYYFAKNEKNNWNE